MSKLGRHLFWLLLASGCYESEAGLVGVKSSDVEAEAGAGGPEAGAGGPEAGAGGPEAGAGGSDSGPHIPLSAGCSDDTSRVPKTLECTGLYQDIAKKRIAKSVVSFAPAVSLWSDAAKKRRWIYLPPGKKIDNSDPNAWVFPVGTKLWKEFRVDGKRIETRLFWKVRSDRWLKAPYEWNGDETAAEFSFGGDIEIDSGIYHVPKQSECEECHNGQEDSVLGFSEVLLGLPGAEGITLAQLQKNGWLKEKPARTELSIGEDETGLDDDGEPLAAKALGILHTNCGLTCHNETPRRTANLTNQNLRLDVQHLDGNGPDESWNVLNTAVGKAVEGAQWDGGEMRIIPGNPDDSLLVRLMSMREANGDGGQMPPIGTRKVDTRSVRIIRKWIERLDAPD